MSMIETEAPAAPKRKTKHRRKAAPKAPKAPAEFAGLTVTDCATGCGVHGCVISGKPYCAHPNKGALQGKDMGDPDAIARLARAKKAVGKQKIDPNKL